LILIRRASRVSCTQNNKREKGKNYDPIFLVMEKGGKDLYGKKEALKEFKRGGEKKRPIRKGKRPLRPQTPKRKGRRKEKRRLHKKEKKNGIEEKKPQGERKEDLLPPWEEGNLATKMGCGGKELHKGPSQLCKTTGGEEGEKCIADA